MEIFVQNGNYHETPEIQRSILNAYENDFSKHSPSNSITKIKMLWNALPGQLAKENKKYILGSLKTGARAKDFELAIHWLEYWTAKEGKAEVDFLVQYSNNIIPIEVKAEENLKSKSLKYFCEKYNPETSVRTSMSNYRKQNNLTNIPLYAISMLKQIIDKENLTDIF